MKGEQQAIIQSKVAPNELANLLKGLSHPIRITLLTKIADGGKYHSELAEITRISPAPLNFHLNTLRAAGLISQETVRGKYVPTETGLLLLSTIARISESLTHFEVTELDRYCILCGEAKMKIAVYPYSFQAFCPSCGVREEGPPNWKWTMTGLNPYGEDWKHHDIEDFVDEGWKEEDTEIKQYLNDGKCPWCGSKVDYTITDDRTRGTCPACEGLIDRNVDWASDDVLLPFWKKYKKIKQKVEGPMERNGIPCWKITLSTLDQKHKAIQYRRTKTGEVLETLDESG